MAFSGMSKNKIIGIKLTIGVIILTAAYFLHKKAIAQKTTDSAILFILYTATYFYRLPFEKKAVKNWIFGFIFSQSAISSFILPKQ